MALLLLAGLTVFGLALRLTGLAFLVPHAWEPDSLVFVRQTEYFDARASGAHADVFYGYYPHLIPRLVTLAPRAAPGPAPESLSEHLAAASAPRVRIRRVVAALSVLIVPGTWLLARRFLSRAGALFASALVATSVLHLWFAQETRPHGLSCVFALFAVVAALRLRARGDPLSYAWAGFTAILAVDSLQSGVAVLLPLAVAHVLRAPDRIRRPHLAFGLVLGAVALSIPVFYPFLFEQSRGHDAAALDIEGRSLNLSGHGIDLGAFDGRGFQTAWGALKNYEPLLGALGLVGLLLAGLGWLTAARAWSARQATSTRAGWRARFAGREDLTVVLAYVLPYALVIGLYGLTYQRFVLPLLPYLAVLAAWGLFTLTHRVVSARGPVPRGETAAFLLALACFALQTWAATKLVWIRTQPDTAARAARWIEGHLKPGESRIALSPSLDLPLFRTPAALAAFPAENERTLPWIVHQRQLAPEVVAGRAFDLWPIPLQDAEARAALVADAGSYVASLGVEYAVIEHFRTHLRPYNERLRIGLERRARLVARFSPLWVDTGDDLPLAYQDDDFERRGVWWARVLVARSMGPVVEIWRLNP